MAIQRRKFSEAEKLGILESAEKLGVTAVLREHRLSYSVFVRWKKKLKMAVPAPVVKLRSELKQLLEENGRLKKIIAQQALELELREEDIRKLKKNQS